MVPVGAADVAMQAALFSLHTSCCASSGNSASMQAPGRRSASRFAKLDGDVEGDLVVVLIPAPALGLQGVNETGVDIFRDRLKRNLTVALSLEGALAQFRRELTRAADQILGRRDTARRRGRPQFSKAHVKFLPLTPDCASVTMESRS